MILTQKQQRHFDRLFLKRLKRELEQNKRIRKLMPEFGKLKGCLPQ